MKRSEYHFIDEDIRNNITKKDLKNYAEVNPEGHLLGSMSDEALKIVAKLAGVDFNAAKKARDAYLQYESTVSLDKMVDTVSNEGHKSSTTILDLLNPYDTLDPDLIATPTLEEELEKQELRKAISQVLKRLSPREEAVIRLRFGFDDGEEKTLEAIGKKYHLTRERIRQIQANTFKKLRKYLKSEFFKDII